MANQINYGASLFIGETSQGVRNPIFFDPHTPIYNNKPPTTIVTGIPGSGKTFFLQLLACQSSIMGKTTIVIDPKGDFLNLKEIEGELGANVNFINIAKKKGALDPFYNGENEGDKLSTIIDTISILVGGVTENQKTAILPTINDMINENGASMETLYKRLHRSEDPEVRSLASNLEMSSKLEYANIIFAPGGNPRSRINFKTGMTIFPLLGIDLPIEEKDMDKSGSVNKATRPKENLGAAIMFLLTDIIRKLLKKKTIIPKTLIIDEAWVLASNDAGRRCIKEVGLLGRSRGIALILASQKNSHYESLDTDSTTGNRFCFAASEREAEFMVDEFDLPQGENFENIFTSLEGGECFMRDWSKNYATVKIMVTKKSWYQVFRSDPLKDREAAVRQREERRNAN